MIHCSGQRSIICSAFSILVILAISLVGCSEKAAPVLPDPITSAMVIVTTDGPGQPAQGSGFIVRQDQEAVYILTAAHLVMKGWQAAKVTVRFNGGTEPKPVIEQISVAAFDDRDDLAVIKVVGTGLPAPVDLPETAPPMVNDPITVLGFPTSDDVANTGTIPVLKPCNATVSGLIQEQERVQGFKIEGDFDPGYSGGAVIDQAGRLIGMAVTRFNRSPQASVLSGEELKRMLRGRVKLIEFSYQDESYSKNRWRVEAEFFDPFNQMAALSLALGPRGQMNLDLSEDQTQEQRSQLYERMTPPISLTKSHGKFKRAFPAENLGDATADQPFVAVAQVEYQDGQKTFLKPKPLDLSNLIAILQYYPPVLASPLNETAQTILLPSEIKDLDVGGWGRRLVLLLDQPKEIAVFDLVSEKILYLIPLTSDEVCFAAGANKLVVITRGANRFERYDLGSGERELAILLPFSNEVRNISMGSGEPDTALLMRATSRRSEYCRFNFMTLQLGDCLKKTVDDLDKKIRHLRPAANNSLIITTVDPEGAEKMVLLKNDGATIQYAPTYQSFEVAVPDFQGSLIFSERGIYNRQMHQVMEGLNPASLYVPDPRSDIFMEVVLNSEFRFPRCRFQALNFRVAGNERPLISLPLDLIGFTEKNLSHSKNDFTLDKHFHLLVEEKRIIIIPDSNDRILVIPFDLKKALDEAGLDYLFIVSNAPPPARKGESFSYEIKAASRRGGIRYSLDSAPAGMKISDDGLISWDVPEKRQGPPNEFIILSVSDDSKRVVTQSFEIKIE